MQLLSHSPFIWVSYRYKGPEGWAKTLVWAAAIGETADCLAWRYVHTANLPRPFHSVPPESNVKSPKVIVDGINKLTRVFREDLHRLVREQSKMKVFEEQIQAFIGSPADYPHGVREFRSRADEVHVDAPFS